MSLLNPSHLQQSLLLAGTLSLYSGVAQAQTVTPEKPVAADSGVASDGATASNPEGRAGVATLCIEKRSYVDPMTKKIVTPTIYIDAMPKEGINTGYVEGNAVAKQWEDFLNPKDEERKKWLEDTDIPDQAKEAIDLMKRLDKNKDGIISVQEFEEGEQGKSLEDKKIDLAFLTSLRCDNLFFTEGPTNSVDVEKFPDVISLRGDLAATQDGLNRLSKTHTTTLSELEAERKKSKNFLYATIGLGGLGLLLGVGLVVALRRKKGEPKPPAGNQPTGPKKAAEGTAGGTGAPKVAVTINNASPAKTEVKEEKAASGYDDVMSALGSETPNEDVLKALADDGNENKEASEAQPSAASDTASEKLQGDEAGKAKEAEPKA